MHDCPLCQEACYCDGEDAGMDLMDPEECFCECEEEEWEGEDEQWNK